MISMYCIEMAPLLTLLTECYIILCLCVKWFTNFPGYRRESEPPHCSKFQQFTGLNGVMLTRIARIDITTVSAIPFYCTCS